MDPAGKELANQADAVIRIQLAIGGLVATGFFLVVDIESAQAAVFGALMSMVLGWLLSRGLAKAGAVAAQSPEQGRRILYAGAVQRFLLVIGLCTVGLVVMKLNGLAMVTGFVATQLAYLLGRRSVRQ